MSYTSLSPEIVKDKIVAVRVDYNVPIRDNKVTEPLRIEASIPTLKYLIDNGAKRIHILSHLGRPKGVIDEKFSLTPVLPVLESLLGTSVTFRKDMTPSDDRIQLHENVRFHPGEKKNTSECRAELQKIGAEVFVLDGFAVAHRAQASVVGLADTIPAYPGFLVESEIQALSPYLSTEKIPGLAVIVSGLKMETKVPVLKHFARIADHLMVGGGIANTLAVAEGFDVGNSFYEESFVETAREVLEIAEAHSTGVHIPIDVVCGEGLDSEESVTVPLEDVIGDMMILDVGPHTVQSYEEILSHAKKIIWNGPVGVFEKKPFENGTKLLAHFVSKQKNAETIIGGGDTINALKYFEVDRENFSHISTGGGAMLEFLQGKELPGIAIFK